MREDFDIRLDDGEVQAAFNRLLRAGQDLTPAPRAGFWAGCVIAGAAVLYVIFW